MKTAIDLNADGGEGFGAYTIGVDDEMLRSVSSISVACGFHGGDPMVIRQTIRAARAAGVAVGAHPGFPDLQGFGRRVMHIPPDELTAMLVYQIGALAGLAAAEGTRLRHVKAHGALYNMAMHDQRLADAIADATAVFDGLALFAPRGSTMAAAAGERGVRLCAEAFLDRAYNADGTLVSRSDPGALITDPARIAERAVMFARDGNAIARDGTRVRLDPETLCIHSDTPGAGRLAASARAALEAAGIRVAAP
jgi:UPF0271 protein